MIVTHPLPPLERGEKHPLKIKTLWTSAYSAALCYRDPSSLKAPLDDKMKSAQNDKMKNKNSVELCELCGEKPNAARSVPTPFRINYQLSIINYQLKNYQLKKWKTKTKAFGVKF